MGRQKERPLPEPSETDLHAAAVLAEALARHAAALHVVFMRGFADVLAKKERSLRDAGRALKAQNQCRIALGLVLKLRAVIDSQKNSRNRTNGLLGEEISHHDQALGKAAPEARLCSTETPPQRVELVAPRSALRHSSRLAVDKTLLRPMCGSCAVRRKLIGPRIRFWQRNARRAICRLPPASRVSRYKRRDFCREDYRSSASSAKTFVR